MTHVVRGGVEGDRLDAARLLGQGQIGGGDAAGGQRARRREAPKLDLKMRISFLVIPLFPSFERRRVCGVRRILRIVTDI